MKKIVFFVLLFLGFTVQAKTFYLRKQPAGENVAFIDADNLIKYMPSYSDLPGQHSPEGEKAFYQNNRNLAKLVTGKVIEDEQNQLWIVNNGVKEAEYPIITFVFYQREAYQKPDGRLYDIHSEQEQLFTGILILSEEHIEKEMAENTISKRQKYKDGLPDGPEYEEETGFLESNGKPIIYLYPTEEAEVTVKVGNPEKFTHTYPKYGNGWRVLAKPNGDLTDLKTGRHLYALYWEGQNTTIQEAKDGFVVKGSDTISFLEEKLAQLGLNEREADEFIIYWLPKLEGNPYNLIRFESIAQQNENMPLDIMPKPDTLIRVLMEYKTLDKKIDLPEQILPPAPARTGFTVVEWGGTELKEKD